MGEKDKYHSKWCHVCDMEVENKKNHYLAEHPEKIWKKVKGFNIVYEQEIHDLVSVGTLLCLFDTPDYLFRVPSGEPDVVLSDGKKVKAERIYTFKYPEREGEEE